MGVWQEKTILFFCLVFGFSNIALADGVKFKQLEIEHA
jgi:hypothetical protein